MIETPANPVTRVLWPVDVGEVWGGLYGGAKIVLGEPCAFTSDGKRHEF